MRAVIQRVAQAAVVVDNVKNAAIGRGLLVLLGVEETDTAADVAWLVAKIAQMRIFSDANGLMNLSVQDIGGDVIVVSQFTLFASTKKGNRPSFLRAARPPAAVPLYEQFVEKLSETLGKPVGTGVFGADMQVSLVNDGPVTILIDTQDKE